MTVWALLTWPEAWGGWAGPMFIGPLPFALCWRLWVLLVATKGACSRCCGHFALLMWSVNSVFILRPVDVDCLLSVSSRGREADGALWSNWNRGPTGLLTWQFAVAY
ncbi:hypothetical protein Nepgr_006813 [Nepenthes gracilis]|uniref:Uncharacterized protein n=1 Tax=Nepenthes gracilis TaxID=150966 RepID=A0AAD3S5T6_NEPGR|nr:hypothetical protein Nepgr_006813 [Nepenthes gracilis]